VSSVGAFAVFAAVLAVTPGLDTMLVLRTAALGGRRAGLAAVAGIALGCLAWAVASALGVTAVLAASRLAFDVLRWAGVAYLCYLGVRALLRKSTVDSLPSGGGIRAGLTTNLLNPKVGVFYLSVMPQFLPAGLPVLAGSLLLGAIHIGLGVVWLSLLVLASHRAAGLLRRPVVRRRLEQLSGVVFLGFGLRLALERSPT
jgi:threonine/homoserine/homoserine lactone efflux protein